MEIPLNIDKNDSKALKNLLSSASPEKKIKPFLARTILSMMEEGETPQFIYTDIHIDGDIQAAPIKQLWLILSDRRLMLLNVDSRGKIHYIWEYDRRQNKPLAFQRISRIMADDCRVTGGLWQTEFAPDTEPAFIIEGQKASRYGSYFRALVDFKEMLSALE